MNTAKEVHPCFRGLLTGFTELERQQEDISWVDSYSPVNIMEIDSEGFVRIYASTYRSPSVNHYNPCYVNMEFNKYDVPVNREFKIKATYHFPTYQELDGSELSRTHIWSFHIDQFTGDTEVEIARKITEEIEWSYFDWVFNIRKNKQYYYTFLPEYDERKDIRTLLKRDISGDDNLISLLKLEGGGIVDRQAPLTLNEILFSKETGSLPNWLCERDTMPNILSMNPNKGKGEVEYLLYRPNKTPVRCPSAAIHHQGQMLNKMVYDLVKDEIKTPTPWMEKLGIANPEDVFDLDKVVKVIAPSQDNKNHQKESNQSVSIKKIKLRKELCLNKN